VHVFFLDVGHTHVIIDQIFGVVTKGLVGNEFLFVEDLMANIDDTLAGIPDYQAHRVERLHCLFDFTSWAKDSMGLHPFILVLPWLYSFILCFVILNCSQINFHHIPP
jgi:hypothetical protein